LALGVISLAVMGLILCFTLKIIVWSNKLHPEAKSYEKLVLQLFGKETSVLVTLSVILTTFGACVGFLVIIADLMTAIISMILTHYNSGAHWVSSRIFVTIVLSVIGVLPLASLKSFSSLKFSSTMAIVSVTFTVTVIVIRSVQNFPYADISNNVEYFKVGFGIFDALPLISFAFGCHMQVVPIFAELKNNHENYRINVVTISTNILCMVLYTITGVFGYLEFFDCTSDNILKNYADTDTLVNVARGVLSFVIICHYPPSNYCCRAALDYLFFPHSKLTTVRRLVWTCGIWGAAAVVAILVPQINIVFGLIGATANSLIVFIFPAIFLLCNKSKAQWEGLQGVPALLVGSLILLVGVTISVLGTTFIIVKNYFPNFMHHLSQTEMEVPCL